jgi:tripartite-type tricarboxylate transporter receptor subunit TctC
MEKRMNKTAVFALALCAFAATALAQSYPTKPIRMVVTFPPGGSSDTIARLIGPRLTEKLGQPIVVDNRPGGGGGIGADVVAKAAPDGYTLLVGAAGGLALNPVIYPNTPYDPVKDFAPITLLVTSPFIVAVNPAVTPVNSLKDLIALVKSKPGMPFGSGGTGTGMHLAGELFRMMVHADMTHVPYKGNGPALTDLVGGQIPVAFTDLGSTPPFAKSGRIRILAIASATRTALAPELPTAAEAGLPGWEALGWFGLVAPAATPRPIVQRLNAEVVTILKAPDIHEKILATGNEPAPTTPEAFGEYIRAEVSRWAKVVKESGGKFE